MLMIRLQRVYDRIAQAITERNTAPPEVLELQEQNRLRQEELEQLEKQMESHLEEIQEVRKKEQEWQLELEHFQRQKAQVTNEREFAAVISEIDYATKARDEGQARREELEATIATLSSDLETRRGARPEEEEAQRAVVDSWEQRKDELKDLVHELADEAKDIESQLQPSNRSRFLRLLESKKGSAMAEVVDGSCSLCHFSLRPHLQQRVTRATEIIACEHCRRLLFNAGMEDELGPDSG
jgi:predicted  nucleic acid-binding Zn-ribbon protein